VEPQHTAVFTAHISILPSLSLCREMFLLFGMVGVSYAMLWVVPPAVVQWYTMGWALSCICVAHFYRLLTDFGGYHLDFTGPLMILVQKVTLVAFALHDGTARKESDLNADQKLQRINVKPSVLEYISYTFNFHSLLAGPSITIQEHLQFMDGSNLRTLDNPNAYARVHYLPQSHVPYHTCLSPMFHTTLASPYTSWVYLCVHPVVYMYT